MKDEGKYIIFKDSTIGYVTGYEQDAKWKEKK